MSHDAATQTPDWSQNNDAYFAGSNHVIISSEPYRTTQGNRPPPKAIACQTELNLPRIQFRENDLETALNALGGFGTELIDTTGNSNFSYIWLTHTTAVNPNTNTPVWSAGFSHITLVRDAPRTTTAAAHLIEGDKGTHLTLRATMNDPKNSFGIHMSLPASSAGMAGHFLAILVPTNAADISAANQFWANVTNGFKRRYGADFTKAPWKTFLEKLKSDVSKLLIEYEKLLKGLEESGQKLN